MIRIILVSACFAGAFGDVSEILRRNPRQRLPVSPFAGNGNYNPGVQQAVAPSNQIGILRQEQDASPDGSYKWAYETENGILAQEEGALRDQGGEEPSIIAQGGFAYTSPEGIPISLKYLADANGFHAEGAHLPTPPPIPIAIQRALAWIAANPEPENQF